MTRSELVTLIRSQVAAGLDPGAMLNVYVDPARRRALHERVRHAAQADLSDEEVEQLAAELFGFGVLQRLLDDPSVTDVLVNSADEIYVERVGVLQRVDARFDSAAQVSELAHRIAAGVGRELTLERPFVDARMRDGSRANAVIAPVGGPTLAIRKFSRLSLPLRGTAPSWVADGALSFAAADLLAYAVRAHANVLIVGATGAGKSTLLRSLAAEIPAHERIVVIEDTNELVLPHPHVVHLEGQAGRESPIGIADLVANALRMRPDRIIVGEVRTPREATALLDALTTGHDGSITTAHAGSAAGAVDRLELLLARAGEAAPGAIRRHVLSAFDVIVHVTRVGPRRLIDEIASVENNALRALYTPEADAVGALPAKLLRRLP
ncbi:MAG: Flp pilus assembly complex ATPase component TadA [Chloroflexota bacterium]|nr:Flp pilus assembly complex ATPase component TadA [Chloroflexota bacterium]